MISDNLTSDIMFGNINNMLTVWITNSCDHYNQDKFKTPGFKLGM